MNQMNFLEFLLFVFVLKKNGKAKGHIEEIKDLK